MKLVILVLLLGAIEIISVASQSKTRWNDWKQRNRKRYRNKGADDRRFKNFDNNQRKIDNWNKRRSKKNEAILELNEFADLSPEEFKALWTGALTDDNPTPEPQALVNQVKADTLPPGSPDTSTSTGSPDTSSSTSSEEAGPEEANPAEEETAPEGGRRFLATPTSWDWRTKGAVTSVKNQNKCACCWAFAATAAVEGFHKIQGNTLKTFSAQYLLDCETDQQGCSGGYPWRSLDYIADYGTVLDSSYPYTAVKGTCKKGLSKTYPALSGYQMVTTKNLAALKAAIVKTPVSVVVQADQEVFQFYKSDIIQSNCGSSTNHVILAVGYGVTNGVEYIICKNSFGTGWGEAGYVKIASNPSANGGLGVCGILYKPHYPIA